MQRRVRSGRAPIRLALLACLALPLLPGPTGAQALLLHSKIPGTPAQDDRPQLLLVVRRDPKASPHDEATRVALQDAVLGLMRDSGHYQVTVYTPTQPLVKRALLDHAISSIDLNEPLQPEGMRHLALVLGIRTILLLTPTFDKTGLKMESQLHQNVGQDAWQIGVTDEVTTGIQYGKRRLNAKETIAVSVDALAARLSIPSHLAADLNLKATEAAVAAVQKPDKSVKAHKDPPTKAAQPPKTEVAVIPDKTQPPPDTAVESTQPTIVVKPDLPREPKTPKTRETRPRVTRADKSTKGAKRSDDPLIALHNAKPQTGPGTGRADVPTAQTVAHANYETLSDHYRDNRDLANTITLLRYAVNERPSDIPLRRKLILAYQERKMPETALAEIARALQIAPNDGSLYRAYGDTLMTKGEVPAAEKAYRDAVRLNADDIQARIALGDALMLDNQYAEALDSYAAAQKTDPRSPLPHRRLGRVLLLRASADPTQYTASLEEIARARDLTPKSDTVSYQEDYGTLMQITESRIRELLEEVSGNFIAYTTRKQSPTDVQRALSDIQVRADTINSYLDKLPSAVGQDATQVHYQQSATLLLMSVTLFRNYLTKNDPNVKQKMEDAKADAYHELETAHQHLLSIRAALIPK
jgi:tetratricopeptide (TPR) repeat protein